MAYGHSFALAQKPTQRLRHRIIAPTYLIRDITFPHFDGRSGRRGGRYSAAEVLQLCRHSTFDCQANPNEIRVSKPLSWAEFSEEVAPGTIRHTWRGEGRRIISLRGRTFQ